MGANPPTILIVDDTPENLSVLGELLQPTYRVRAANSGRRALQIALGVPTPDLILLDVMMPEMDGYDVLSELRAAPATRNIPVIFVTAMDGTDDEERGLDHGAVDYITKPIHAGELNARVSTHTALRRRISDLNSLKNALWQSEVRYRLLVENTPDLFWEVDGQLNTLYVSPQIKKLIGITPAELIGKPIIQIFSNEADWLRPLIEESGISQLTRIEVSATHADGSPRILDVSASVLRGDGGAVLSILGVARDITERKANEKRLEQLSLAVESSPVSVVISDVNGVIESLNAAFSRMTGYSEEEIIGQEMKILRSGVHPDSFFDALWVRLREGASERYEFCNRRKDGSIYWVHQAISPIFNKAGEISHFVWVGEDFTEAKHQEQMLREAKEAAEKATQAKSDFLANMSHEIRTPMNAIIGLSHLCLNTQLDPRQLDYLSNISSAAKSLLAIINDILDFSKIEAGRLQLEKIPFDLSSVFAHTANLNMAKAREKELSLVFRQAPEVPQKLIGDPTRLGQVLLNLCSNAIKFTQKGEISLECSLLELREDSAYVRFSVTDQGIGMTEEELKRLFSPFVQADSSTTRKYGGTGLGLTISKQIVEAMGGQIHVSSVPAQGTCFSFEIPLGLAALSEASTATKAKPDADSPVQDHSRPLSEEELTPLQGLRVLLVEDNKFNQQVAMDLLELVGITCDLAENGREAIEQIKAKTFDLVLMDLQMPEMDGLTATRHIRQDLQQTKLPIIAMTANAMAADRDRCLAAGMNAHIGKPIDPNNLYGQLLQWQKAGGAGSPGAASPVHPSTALAAQAPAANGLDLPGFDTELALSRMRGNVAHYQRMLGLFAAEFHDIPAKIQAALDAAELSTAKRLAHTIKGSAGTMGATKVQALAAQLDKQLEAGDASAASTTLPEFAVALNHAVEKITALQASNT